MDFDPVALKAAYTIDNLKPLVGENFDVDLGEYGLFPLKLVEVTSTPVGRGETSSVLSGPASNVLSIVWIGPKTPILAQRTFFIEHPSIGKHPVFLGPVKEIEDGIYYQAIFT